MSCRLTYSAAYYDQQALRERWHHAASRVVSGGKDGKDSDCDWEHEEDSCVLVCEGEPADEGSEHGCAR